MSSFALGSRNAIVDCGMSGVALGTIEMLLIPLSLQGATWRSSLEDYKKNY